MCDCQDINNINSIPVGPPGPTGPTGPQGPAGSAPNYVGVSTSNVTVGTGSKDFILTAPTNFAIGQRVAITSSDLTATMNGVISSYDTGANLLTIAVDNVIGSGTYNGWNVVLSGAKGDTGATGATGATGTTGTNGVNAYTTASVGVNSGTDLYTLSVTNSSWATVGQMVYVQGAGYYVVYSKPANDSMIVQNLGTPGNIPGNLVFGGSLKTVSPAGVQGANGANGTNGFVYETVDGNNIPAQAASPYMLLMRNADNTGYVFTSLSDLKTLLALLP